MQWLILHAAKTFACSTPLDSRHFIFTFFFFLVYNSHSVAAALKWRCQGEWVSLMRRFHCPWVLNQQQNCPVKPNQTSSSFCISAGQYLKYTENMKLNDHLKQHHVCSSASIYKFIGCCGMAECRQIRHSSAGSNQNDAVCTSWKDGTMDHIFQ